MLEQSDPNFKMQLPSSKQPPSSWQLRAIKSEVEDIKSNGAGAKPDSKLIKHSVSPILYNPFALLCFVFV